MQKITPFLWFNGNIREALDLYTSVFKNAKVHSTSPGPEGRIMNATFELEGQQFMALDGGPHYQFNEAVSFFVSCSTQEEVDYYWQKLTANGGSEGPCGWLKDPFGMSWQVIPNVLGELLGNSDRQKANRALQAMMKMKKIDIAALEAAANNA